MPPPPPQGEWQTQTGPRQPNQQPGAAQAEEPEVTPTPEPTPPPPPPDPLFDDSPLPFGFAAPWEHTPSANVVSTETYTEEACTRLLADTSLPPVARALVMSGRARARARMWRIDEAVADIEEALRLDASAAQLQLILAEILSCLGRTDEADAILQNAFRLDPESTLAARALGLIRFQQGSMDAAAEALSFHLESTAQTGIAAGDATLPLLRAVAAGETGSLEAVDNPTAAWPSQLAAFLNGRIDRDTLLARARDPVGVTLDEAACTAWFYLAQRSLARNDRARATLDLLAAARTGCTSAAEYRLAVAGLIRLGELRADSLPGRLAE